MTVPPSSRTPHVLCIKRPPAMMPPPNMPALLLDTVLFATFSTPAEFSTMPPPLQVLQLATFPWIQVFVTLRMVTGRHLLNV